MSDTFTRDERRSSLEDFVQMATPPNEAQLPMVVPAAQAPAIIGAQDVKVKRDERLVLAKVKALAAAAGETWYYRYPVKDRKKGTTEWIEGPSVQLTDDVARIYGNCEVDCRATDLGSVYLFHARFIDLETGFALTRPFQQRKNAARIGGADEGRRDEMAMAIGASKATRNVTQHALRTFVDFAFDEARNALVDKIGSNLPQWRDRAVERIAKLTSLDRVEAVIGRAAKDWLAPDVARVIAMGKAINDGMATVDETFPPLGKGGPADLNLDSFASEPSSPPAAGQAAAGNSPETVVPRQPAAADPITAAEPAPVSEVIPKLLALARDQGSVQDRLEALELSRVMLGDLYPGHDKFLTYCIAQTAKVIRGDAKASTAESNMKKELESTHG